MTGKPLPGCVPPPPRYLRLNSFEAVLRAQGQHLREAVGKVEGRTAVEAIEDYIKTHNESPKPLRWQKSADEILAFHHPLRRSNRQNPLLIFARNQ
jgi:hypothetical protein